MPAPSGSPSPFCFQWLRKDARRLLRACRAGDTAAIARVRTALPRLSGVAPARVTTDITLADVHHAIAREHGCANWAGLKRAGDPLERLLVAVRGGALDALASSLHEFAGLASESVHAACALGDADALARHLDRDESFATLPHRGWPPLAYVCASPIHRIGGRYSAGLLACATILLDRGADPDTSTTHESADDARAIPVAYRAVRTQNMAIVLLLQRRGASERLLLPFRSDMARDIARNEWQDVINEYMQRPDIRGEILDRIAAWRVAHPEFQGHATPLDLRQTYTNAWEASPLAMPWLDVPRWSIPWDRLGSSDAVMTAVTHTGPPPLIELLLDRGFDPDARHPSGRSLVAMAIRAGRRQVADLLRRRGATATDVEPRDDLLGACMRLDAAAARAITRHHPAVLPSLAPADFDVLAAAARASLEHLRLMLAIGMPAGGCGTGGVTALHVAAWHGRVAAVDLLLDHGAPVHARDTLYGGTPLDWSVHGATHCRTADDDYNAVARALASAARTHRP